jgi:hypothetical protein
LILLLNYLEPYTVPYTFSKPSPDLLLFSYRYLYTRTVLDSGQKPVSNLEVPLLVRTNYAKTKQASY